MTKPDLPPVVPLAIDPAHGARAVAIAIAIVDARGEILHANPSLVALLGDAGASLIDRLDLRDRPTLRAAILGAADATFDVRVRRREGEPLTLSCTCTPLEPGRACIAFALSPDRRHEDRERRQFQFMADLASDAFFLVDDRSVIVYANRVAHAERGYAPGELIGLPTHAVSPTYPVDRVNQLFDDTATGVAFRLSHEHRRKDGSTFPVESSVNRIEFDGRHYLFSAARDVTEQRAAARAIREERERMAMVVEQSNVGVWYAPLPIGELTWDAKVKEHFFLPPDADANADVFYARLHPDDRAPTAAAIARSADEGVPYDVVYRTVAPDGSNTKSIHAFGRTHYDERGTPVLLDGLTFDVTRQVRDAEALRESEARLQLALAIAELGTFEIDFAARSIELNEAGRAIYGFGGVGPVSFERARSTAHPDDGDAAFDVIRDAIAPGGSGRFELEQHVVREQDGAARWLRIRGLAVFGDGAARPATRCIGTFVDVTDQKETDARRERLLAAEHTARVEAEAATRLKDEFLTTLSHELRTPLNAILGWATLLRRSDKSADPSVAKGLEAIERNARVQAQVIGDLLDVRQIVSGALALEIAENVDLAAAVRECLDVVRLAADAKAIRIEAFGLDVPLLLRGDRARLRQVASTLLSNAVKFTPRDGAVRVMLARVDDDDAYAELRIADDGEGIEAAFVPHVFDRFRQADASTTRRHGGLGLGLAIARPLVEQHGGSIMAASDGLGRGATFTVRLPITARRAAVGDATDPPTAI